MKKENYNFDWISLSIYGVLFYQKDVSFRPEQFVETKNEEQNIVYNGIAEGVLKKFNNVELDFVTFPWYEMTHIARTNWREIPLEQLFNNITCTLKNKQALIEYLNEHVTTEEMYNKIKDYIIISCSYFYDWTCTIEYTIDGEIDRPPLEFRRLAKQAMKDIKSYNTL